MGLFSFLNRKKTKFKSDDVQSKEKARKQAAKTFKSKNDRLEVNMTVSEAVNEALVRPCKTDQFNPDYESYFDEMELMDEDDKKLARFKT